MLRIVVVIFVGKLRKRHARLVGSADTVRAFVRVAGVKWQYDVKNWFIITHVHWYWI